MVSEQLFPEEANFEQNEISKSAWKNIHSRLSMELGLERLIQPMHSNPYQTIDPFLNEPKSVVAVCKTWMLTGINEGQDADVFMKHRISFIELAFRERMQVLINADANQVFIANEIAQQIKSIKNQAKNAFSDIALAMHESNLIKSKFKETEIAKMHAVFAASCSELNERFRRAKCPLNYHNGFIQIETDVILQKQVAEPFWNLVSDAKWKNVETDMMEAVDRSESAQRDPAFYAAKALESAIKIISDERGWTTGKERGAGQYIENLRSPTNGGFIKDWEAKAIQLIFSSVRNGLGHGPGREPMPVLTQQQTDWTIEAAMSWTKSLIGRL